MAANNFKPFGIGTDANVTAQADYETLAALLSGFQSGKASSAQVNKAIRQGTVMASVLAQFIANSSGNDVLDNGDTATIITNLIAALKENSANDFLQTLNNLLEIKNAGTAAQTSARTNLGLGNSATLNTGTATGTVAAGNDSRITGAAQKSSNLSDLASAASARNNLGLGTAATASVGVGTNQIPDMNSFVYSTDDNSSFVMKFPGGVIIQGANFTTDANGFAQITMGVAMSSYQVIAAEGQSGGWLSSGGLYTFLTAYGANKVSSTQFSVRSASWRSSDKNFIAQSTVGTWLAFGRI